MKEQLCFALGITKEDKPSMAAVSLLVDESDKKNHRLRGIDVDGSLIDAKTLGELLGKLGLKSFCTKTLAPNQTRPTMWQRSLLNAVSATDGQ